LYTHFNTATAATTASIIIIIFIEETAK